MSTQSRRPHKKSRAGCLNCKRRKVKCDESKPHCISCSRFGMDCVWPILKQCIEPAPKAPCVNSPARLQKCPKALSQAGGRGRPRNNWSDLLLHAQPVVASKDLNVQQQGNLNIQDTELVLHFIQSTAKTLAGNESPPDSSIARFWTLNVPRIGLSYPFVLHLMYALAAYHMASQYPTGHERRDYYRAVASTHLSRGTIGLANTTSDLDKDNCGAAYLGATLLCYCTFAAGPSASEDLMICYLGTDHNIRWSNLVSGLRLIRQAFAPEDLFSGLMSPLGPSLDSSDSDHSRIPLCKELGKVRLPWKSALAKLDAFASRQKGQYTQCCLVELGELHKVYEGVYGDEIGGCNVSADYRHVLGWLYRLDGQYIQAVQGADAAALAILAHFSVLLKMLQEEWWLDGWAEHICLAVGELVRDSILEWPMQYVFCDS